MGKLQGMPGSCRKWTSPLCFSRKTDKRGEGNFFFRKGTSGFSLIINNSL